MNLAYEIDDKVHIIPLNRPGRVVTIWITRHGIQYEVRFFDNAKMESVYFYADELKFVEHGNMPKEAK